MTHISGAIVGQSGGPTAAINATLAGVIRGAAASAQIGTLYGMRNGIEGLLDGKIVDLGEVFKSEADLSLLENTPAAALGSCRRKLPDTGYAGADEIYKKIFDTLDKLNIGYFFYIGGNDSMDTVKKLSAYALQNRIGTKLIGVPKTIDNDLGCTDHSPGYGSAAKYVAATMQELCHDNAIYAIRSVVIAEIMGRDAGWLTAASALPRLSGGMGPQLLYLPEVAFSDERFLSDIALQLESRPNVVIAVSEGVKYADGSYVCEGGGHAHESDIFGHKWLSGTAQRLKCLVKERFGCKVRAIELNTPQRCASHIASLRDLTEAVQIGRAAAEAAVSGNTGVMMTFRRVSQDPYEIAIGCEDIRHIANKIKAVPPEYINSAGNNVTDECLRYIQPLIMGEPKLEYQNGLPRFFVI